MSTNQGTPQTPPPGWYPETGSGHLRWWDGQQWGPYAPAQQPAAPHYGYAPSYPPVVPFHHPRQGQRTANHMPVSYVRPQQGHSLTTWIILSCLLVGIPFLIYFSVSPNHYWTS